MSFEILVPGGSAPVASRSHRKPPDFGQRGGRHPQSVPRCRSDPTLDFAILEPRGGRPAKIWRGSDHCPLQEKLNGISRLSQLPIPRMDQVLDSLGKGRDFSPFDLASSFHQTTAHKDTVPLTAFCTPTDLYEWLVMPQGSSASPGWFVKVINEVTKGLEQVVAYLDDVIVFDSDPQAHDKTIRALFERLRQHNLKLSLSKARLGATDAHVLGHSISPAGVRPNAEKVSALTLMPMPSNLKQLRSLLGGLSYYRTFLLDMSKRIRPITARLTKGIKCLFTPRMELSHGRGCTFGAKTSLGD